jgi:hypothetical protein
LQYALLGLKEKGTYSLIRSRNKIPEPFCGPQSNVTGLGLGKLFTLFLILFSGAIGGLVLFILEQMIRPQRSTCHKINPKAQFFMQSALDSITTAKLQIETGDPSSDIIKEKLNLLIRDLSVIRAMK